MISPHLHPFSFGEINNWENDDHLAAFDCFCQSALRIIKRPYTTKLLGVASSGLVNAANCALSEPIRDGKHAKRFFEKYFRPHKFLDKHGMLTGYFEPEHQASSVATREFKYPIYTRPHDLVDVNDKNRPADMDADFAFGRQTASGITQYFDRYQINNGALSGRNLELCWLKDPVDVFFIHIQGSARLTLEDGSVIRISYAAKSGHAYTPIGKILADRGEMELPQVTMDSIRQWLHDNPNRRDQLLEENRSYIFFQKPAGSDMFLGPVAAAGVALTPGRSLAIDHRLHTFGTPIWIKTTQNHVGEDRPLERLVISQDTGSAITGPVRGDLFVGSGPAAGHLAGQIKHQVCMSVLVPDFRLDRV